MKPLIAVFRGGGPWHGRRYKRTNLSPQIVREISRGGWFRDLTYEARDMRDRTVNYVLARTSDWYALVEGGAIYWNGGKKRFVPSNSEPK